jgi:hypothetical protein
MDKPAAFLKINHDAYIKHFGDLLLKGDPILPFKILSFWIGISLAMESKPTEAIDMKEFQTELEDQLYKLREKFSSDIPSFLASSLSTVVIDWRMYKVSRGELVISKNNTVTGNHLLYHVVFFSMNVQNLSVLCSLYLCPPLLFIVLPKDIRDLPTLTKLVLEENKNLSLQTDSILWSLTRLEELALKGQPNVKGIIYLHPYDAMRSCTAKVTYKICLYLLFSCDM